MAENAEKKPSRKKNLVGLFFRENSIAPIFSSIGAKLTKLRFPIFCDFPAIPHHVLALSKWPPLSSIFNRRLSLCFICPKNHRIMYHLFHFNDFLNYIIRRWGLADDKFPIKTSPKALIWISYLSKTWKGHLVTPPNLFQFQGRESSNIKYPIVRES